MLTGMSRQVSQRLATYAKKRDFSATPEPRAKRRKSTGTRIFCVQKHLARSLHYDLRLEHEGVLLSWAVPKGPSLNPNDKRLAARTEDHPLDYGSFEGVIPSGYGAGLVMLWDRGSWLPQNGDVEDALRKGELKFKLDGVKLKGSWVLVRTRPRQRSAEEWLLIKHKDNWSGEIDVTLLAPLSVKSFDGYPEILRKHGIPSSWRKSPPVRSGTSGKLLREAIRLAGMSDLTNVSDASDATPPASRRLKLPAGALTYRAGKPRLSNLASRSFPTVSRKDN